MTRFLTDESKWVRSAAHAQLGAFIAALPVDQVTWAWRVHSCTTRGGVDVGGDCHIYPLSVCWPKGGTWTLSITNTCF